VVITSTADRIFERVEELRVAGIRAEGVVADLTDQAGVDAVVAAARDPFGGVDILVNNAGMTSVVDRHGVRLCPRAGDGRGHTRRPVRHVRGGRARDRVPRR
jgi:NAD(P)-dependent dehydrogenase (short-subunit alcohol dehydrogenase family)